MLRVQHLKSVLRAWSLGLFLALCTVGCGRFFEQRAADPPEIRIGIIVDLRNIDREHLHNVARLMEAEIADRGGIEIGGQTYRLVLLIENVNTSDEAVTAARRLVYQRNVLALVGPNLTRSAAPVGTVAQNARVPLISPASTHPQVTASRDYVFRASFTDPDQAQALARFAREYQGAETVAILFDIAQAYNRDISNRFREVFETSGGQVTAYESYTSGTTDFSEQLTRIREARPDVLFLPNFDADVRLQTEQAAQLGIDVPVLGSDAWTPENLASLPLLEGAFLSQHWHPDLADTNQETRRFLAAYRLHFAQDPFAMTALNYDALGLLLHALNEAGSTEPEAIRNALAQIEGYRGVSGSFSFRDRGGDPHKPICILRIRGKQVEFHGLVSP